MPSRKYHEERSTRLLGDPFTLVHRFKDAPSRNLGKRHRRLFHDDKTALGLGALAFLLTRDLGYAVKAGLASKIHDLDDWISTGQKRRKRK